MPDVVVGPEAYLFIQSGEPVVMTQRPDYGVDSPVIILTELLFGVIAFGVAMAFPHLFGLPARWIGLLVSVYFLNSVAGMLFYSKVGKLRIREELLGSVPWRGDETVLDVGCGRGLLLVGAAGRLTTGKAIGVDVWMPKAVSGNRPEAALENARLEGVRDLVEVENGDARQLPFADGSFDLVVSNFVLHEMKAEADREKMVREIVRVLKPGGRVVLADFIFTGECVEQLRRCGARDARRVRMGRFNFWSAAITSFGLVRLYQVTGSKTA